MRSRTPSRHAQVDPPIPAGSGRTLHADNASTVRARAIAKAANLSTNVDAAEPEARGISLHHRARASGASVSYVEHPREVPYPRGC